ncbi:syntaxin binding protein 1 [Coemansia spiralis]|nr:syntaxin binding protein 1 [Coemansia spiralis]
MRLIALLDDRTLDTSDRIRILFIYLACINGGSALDRRRLEEVPQCMSTNDKRAAVGLRRLGIQTDKDEGDAAQPVTSGRYTWPAAAPTDNGNKRPPLVPAVKHIVSEHVAGTLSTDMFPWTTEPPLAGSPTPMVDLHVKSLRRDKSMFHKQQNRQRAGRGSKGGGRGGVVIVYIAGGVTFSEMRAVYELTGTLDQEVYIGSTHVITPRGFLDDLKSLHLEMLL